MPNELSFSQSPLRPRPAHPERADRLPPLADPLADDPGLNRTATRTLRVLGWLATLGAVLTGLAIVMPTLTTSADDYPLDLLLFMAAGALVAAAFFGIARGVAAGRRWARPAGAVCGAVALAAFPVGTAAGCHVLWRLVFHWQAAAASGD